MLKFFKKLIKKEEKIEEISEQQAVTPVELPAEEQFEQENVQSEVIQETYEPEPVEKIEEPIFEPVEQELIQESEFQEQEIEIPVEIEEQIFEEEPIEEAFEAQPIDQISTPEVVTEEVQDIVEETVEEVVYEEPKSFGLSFDAFKNVLAKTSDAISGEISSVFSNVENIDDDTLDELEEVLINADVGLDLSVEIVNKLRDRQKELNSENVKQAIKEEFKKVIDEAGSCPINYKEGLNIFLITGVNGAGKTTLIGKLAHRYSALGAKVLVAAGDTFRAAAEEQLDIWSKRAGADIVRRDGADSASVVFDSVKKAKEENYDLLLIDTAGRLQNKFNLMEELKKIKKVLDNNAQDCVTESILVIDANTGQNGLAQAEVFQEAVQITAVGLTKLDGSAKGGIIARIAKELKLPVKLIGVGEKMEDLKNFNSDDFVNALFD